MIWRFELTSTTFGTLTIDEPIGWADITVNLKRDMLVHGLTFEYAVGLKFIDNAYAYIKNAYNTLGIDQYIELNVSVKCNEADLFEPFYSGKIFMGKLTFDCSDYCFVEATIEPSGCQMTFKNRIDQKIELNTCKDIDNNPLPCYDFLDYELLMKSKLVKRNTKAIPSIFDTCYRAVTTIPSNLSGGCWSLNYTTYCQPKIESYTINEVLDSIQLSNIFTDNTNDLENFIVAKINGVYKLDVKLNINIFGFAQGGNPNVSGPTCGCTGGNNIFVANTEINQCLNDALGGLLPTSAIYHNDTLFEFVIQKNGIDYYTENLLSNSGSCTRIAKTDYCLNVQQNVPLNKGETIKIFFRFYLGGSFDRGLTTDYSVIFNYGYTQKASSVTCDLTHIDILAETLLPPTPSKVYAINEALSRSVEGITNNCLRVKSDYFGRTDSLPYTSTTDGCGSLEVITNGLHLRQFPDNKVRYAVSFKELYDGLNGIHNLGYGFEPDLNRTGYEWLRVEPMQYWYDINTTLMQCDNVPDLKRRIMAEWYLSIFGFGYEKWEAEQTSGLDEFNVKREYRSTLKEVKRNLNVMSKFISGGYSIEVTRGEAYIADSTKDFRFDNDTFIVCVKRTNDIDNPIEVEQGIDCIDVPNATDIVDPNTVYNARISPNRNFLRWLPYLLSNYYPNYTIGKFQLNTSEGNFKAVMKLVNGCVNELNQLSEGEDISSTDAINTLTPIYRFETVEFDYPMSFQQYKIIKANPKGVIEFRCNDSQTFEKGFINSIQYKPNTGIATLTLIPKF